MPVLNTDEASAISYAFDFIKPWCMYRAVNLSDSSRTLFSIQNTCKPNEMNKMIYIELHVLKISGQAIDAEL